MYGGITNPQMVTPDLAAGRPLGAPRVSQENAPAADFFSGPCYTSRRGPRWSFTILASDNDPRP